MKKILHQAKRHERGSVAVEFAILLPTVLIPLLAAALFFGRFFWHYTVAEKAAHDAVRFIAMASPTEVRGQCKVVGVTVPCLDWAARVLATEEMGDLNPGNGDPQISVLCDGVPCLSGPPPANSANPLELQPKSVAVMIDLSVSDPFLSAFTQFFTGSGTSISIPIHATARTSYVGGN